MPVLHYSPVIGGLETWTQNIAERISDEGNEVFLVTGKVEGQPVFEEKNGVKIFRTSLITLKNLSYSSPFYILTSLPFIFFKSLSVIREENVRLCHCQGFLSSFLGYLLFKITNTPYIVTVQRLETDRGLLRRLAYQNARLCIGSSQAVKDYFNSIGIKNVKVIPNGIDFERFQDVERTHAREKLGAGQDFLIMTVARLEKVKGLKYAIRAMDILYKKYQLSNIKYFIIGEGSERKKIENFIQRLGLGDKVVLLGQIKNEDVPNYLAAADCFLLSSLKEGFGIVVLEAMAASVPIVATGVGGVLDIIEDGKTGLLVEPQNPQKIAEAVFRISSNSGLADLVVSNAEEEVKKYGWDKIAQRVSKIYSIYKK